MGNFEWTAAGFSIFTTIAGAACAVILPVLILGGIGYLLYKRNQQSGAARQTVARYPIGASVTVYYNPSNPAESALER